MNNEVRERKTTQHMALAAAALRAPEKADLMGLVGSNLEKRRFMGITDTIFDLND